MNAKNVSAVLYLKWCCLPYKDRYCGHHLSSCCRAGETWCSLSWCQSEWRRAFEFCAWERRSAPRETKTRNRRLRTRLAPVSTRRETIVRRAARRKAQSDQPGTTRRRGRPTRGDLARATWPDAHSAITESLTLQGKHLLLRIRMQVGSAAGNLHNWLAGYGPASQTVATAALMRKRADIEQQIYNSTVKYRAMSEPSSRFVFTAHHQSRVSFKWFHDENRSTINQGEIKLNRFQLTLAFNCLITDYTLIVGLTVRNKFLGGAPHHSCKNQFTIFPILYHYIPFDIRSSA